jgi:hypothetical protein
LRLIPGEADLCVVVGCWNLLLTFSGGIYTASLVETIPLRRCWSGLATRFGCKRTSRGIAIVTRVDNEGGPMSFKTVAAFVVLFAACALHPGAAGISTPDAAVAMQKFLAQPTVPHSYRATRRLEASGSGQQGWLEVRTDFTPASGLNYEITAEGGSGYIRFRVLRTLLEEERRLIARGDSSRVAISSDNYTFTDEGIDENGLVRVTLRPLRKERPLIAGRMFLTPGDGELVRVEGQLARNPSWWVSRVDLVRSYRRINGAHVPVLLESTAQLRLLGRSTLRMTYQYSEIDDRVTDDQCD